MSRIQTRLVIRFFKKYIPGPMIALIASYGMYFFVSADSIPHQNTVDRSGRKLASPDSRETPLLTDNGSGWRESKGLLYHGIPARILFYQSSADTGLADTINRAAWGEFEKIGRIFNPFDPASEVARLNETLRTRCPPMQLTVSKDVYTVMGISRDIWAQSSGNFDPTLWPLKQLWRDAEEKQRIPSQKDIEAALQSTGFGAVRLADDHAYRIRIKDHSIMFDFGGIVKGYAVDQVREALLKKGVTAGLVQLGGEVSAFGENGGEPWRIGIQHPKEVGKVWGVIAAKGRLSVSTSGNYQQAIGIGGRSFYHIFSPKTGWPVSEKVLGVTIACMGENFCSARLDGIATAITVMGPKNGLALAEKIGIDAIILYETDSGAIGEMMTKGLNGHYMRKDG
ncbi:MAG: FAD:protein FMN transferase [Desulfobacteraceae bacterium]|nr:FAD:protein FMN transferase [Desulfobacteraceae bacterium]